MRRFSPRAVSAVAASVKDEVYVRELEAEERVAILNLGSCKHFNHNTS
jgi:hypothetical protein